jgi:hypothetical protein
MCRKKYCRLALLFLALNFTLLPAYSLRNVLFDDIAAPALLSPVTEDIDLREKNTLEFRWLTTPEIFVYYTEFRLYKSANNFASDLIYKENIQPGNYKINVPSTYFEKGRTYSWTLRIIFTNGNRTEKAYSTFKVISK